ncbi:MAG: site-2 protease family protein [Candidatus Stahlbacteria bacterium]|nr:site-2 protease family protein [Candidatus Stahlbacteria bacterium]
MALRKGDTTARDYGRLTLNPIPHIDIFGTLIFPFLLIVMHSGVIFGWAKPVPINIYSLRNPKRDLMWIGAAGPLSNIGIAVILSVLVRFVGDLPIQVLIYAISINLLLAFFNLIPIPPLDGSRILQGLLPYELQEKYLELERFGFIIIFLLLGVGVINRVLYPLVSYAFHLLTGL